MGMTRIEVDVVGAQLSVALEAGGTIESSSVSASPSKIVHAKASFDTGSFLQTLMANAREIVKLATKRSFEQFLPSPSMRGARGTGSRSIHRNGEGGNSGM